MAHDHLASDVGDMDGRTGLRWHLQPGERRMQLQQGEEMIERKADRRRGVSSYFTAPVNDRRRPNNERRVGVVAAIPGSIRPGPGEALHFGERRRFPDAGTE